MTGSIPPDDLLAQAMEVLHEGRMHLDALVERLDRAGHLDGLRADGVDEEDLAEAVEEELLCTDAVWSSAADVLALSSHLTEGLVLTHRLTNEEIARGEVVIIPDLVVLDWDELDGLELADWGLLEHRLGDRVPGGDNSVLAGPGGWLSDFSPGDVVAFVRTGRSVRVDPAGSLGDDRHEVDLLRGTIEGLIPPGGSDEAVPFILDALTADTTAFRHPVRPLGELLQAAGLEQRGFSFGRIGDDWLTPGEQHALRTRRRLADTWGFNQCCQAAFDQAYGALERAQQGEGVDARAIATSLSHGAVAPALAEYCIDLEREAELAELADAVIAGSPRHTAGARLLVAEVADLHGDALGAEAALRQALRDDPAYGLAASGLARYEFDRSDVNRAITLLHHDELDPDDPLLAFLEEFRDRFDAPFVGVGRNERCPCGSGRKFKVCCARDRVPPLSTRTPLVTAKLALFAGRRATRSGIVGIASSACDPDDPDLASSIADMVREPLIVDFAIWEGGIADDYLAERGDLLPPDERRLIEDLVGQPRRLWEVTAVDPGTRMTLRDTATGDQVVVDEHLASLDREPGELSLARVARLEDQNQLMGMPMSIPFRLRDSALELVDSGPDADQLATWYGQAIAFPILVNSDREPILLCRAELATAVALPELHAALDPVLDRVDEGEWCEQAEREEDEDEDEEEEEEEEEEEQAWIDRGILLGRVAFEGDRLAVETNSEGRLERLLATITAVVPDAEIVVEERTDPRRSLPEQVRLGAPDTETRDDLPPAEVEAMLDQFIRRREAAWVDGSIPALGGLTPRQALDDPTRREDLLALLREMGGHAAVGGVSGFNADRIRSLLGLGTDTGT